MSRERLEKIAVNAWNCVSFDPEKRAKSFLAEVDAKIERLKAELGDRFDEEKLLALYSDIAYKQSRCMSTMITGPSNFPVRKAEKANEALSRAWERLEAWEKWQKRLKSRQDARDKTASEGGELQQAKNKLAQLETIQKMMKDVNAIIRKKPKNELTPEKREEIKKTGFPESSIDKLFEPNFLGDLGFSGFSLTNNNAKIKNAAERVRILEAKEAANNKQWTIEQDGQTVDVYLDYDLDRICIRHSSKPSADVIAGLKKLGMKWSPHHNCWMRQITNNALWSLKRSEYNWQGHNIETITRGDA